MPIYTYAKHIQIYRRSSITTIMADQTLFEAKKTSTNNFFAYWRVGAAFHPDNPWDNPRYPLLASRQALADPAALAAFDASPEARRREWEQRMHGDRVRPGNLAVFNDNIFRQQDANREDLRPPLPTPAVTAPAGGTGGGGPGALSNISPRTVVTAGQQQQQQPPQPPPPSPEDRTPANVRAIAQGFAPSLRRFGVEIEMLRILGYGGNGVVSLFRVQNRNRDARNRRKFVLKQLLRADANLLREKQFTTVRCLYVPRGDIHTCVLTQVYTIGPQALQAHCPNPAVAGRDPERCESPGGPRHGSTARRIEHVDAARIHAPRGSLDVHHELCESQEKHSG